MIIIRSIAEISTKLKERLELVKDILEKNKDYAANAQLEEARRILVEIGEELDKIRVFGEYLGRKLPAGAGYTLLMLGSKVNELRERLTICAARNEPVSECKVVWEFVEYPALKFAEKLVEEAEKLSQEVKDVKEIKFSNGYSCMFDGEPYQDFRTICSVLDGSTAIKPEFWYVEGNRAIKVNRGTYVEAAEIKITDDKLIANVYLDLAGEANLLEKMLKNISEKTRWEIEIERHDTDITISSKPYYNLLKKLMALDSFMSDVKRAEDELLQLLDKEEDLVGELTEKLMSKAMKRIIETGSGEHVLERFREMLKLSVW